MAENERAKTEKVKSEFSFEIVEHITTLKDYNNGWKKEVNIVAWNDAKPKVDVRDWDPEHQHMTRGITLTEAEAEQMAKAIGQRMLDKQKAEMMPDPFER